MRDAPLNPILVDRAVEIWKRALAAPVYNNLAPGEFHLPSMLANAMMADMPKDNTPEKLAAFGAALKALLSAPTLSHDKSFSYYRNSLCTDYHPDQILVDAAEACELKMEFPIKTSMYIDDDRVTFRMGYAAQPLNHHPLADGRWLITDLSGHADMKKLIAAIESGVDLGLTIESA